MTTPPTEQQLDEIETRHTAATPGPWTAVELPANENHKHPAHWVKAEYVDGNCTSSEVVADCPWRQADAEFIAHAREDVPLLLADLRSTRDRVAELEVGLNDLAALVSQWYGRAAHAESALGDVRRIVSRLAAHAAGFQDVLDESDRGPWGRTVGADIAELSAAVAPDAASVPPGAPVSASPVSSVSESAQSPAGAAGGRLGDLSPADEFTGTQPCGHDDYHDPHPWHERPNLWCPGIGYDDDQAADEETYIVADDSSDPTPAR